MKTSKLSTSLLASTAVFAGVLLASGHSNKVSAASYVKINYSSNIRQTPTTSARIVGGLSVGSVLAYSKTATANGYTWYQIGTNRWVASAGASTTAGATASNTGTAASGKVQIKYASNQRSGAGTGYSVNGSLRVGAVYTYTATAKANGYTWYQIGTNKWVASAGAAPYAGSASTSTQPSTPNAASGKVQIKYASNQRSGAGTGYSVNGSLKAGSIYSYTATATANGYTWYQLGANRWVASAGAVPYTGAATGTSTAPSTPTNSSASAKIAAVIALAKTELGKPYVWGGKGPNSFDCSGLMYYVFLHAAGINIGGYTGSQQNAGTRVSLSSLKPGDILFWSSNGSTYHDALYIGNNQYITAPEPGETVKIATITRYFYPSFGVRVLK
ncbi:C40 family peptidase [Lacticaseibacillus sp. N501-2]|uniref:C40 family peptidase n=1 Tax=Lacticaseibacillus salsurae TaxID=3367729 RepID=UPI0038B3DC93